jgi:hypothetical protein
MEFKYANDKRIYILKIYTFIYAINIYLFQVSNLQSLPIPHMFNRFSEPRKITFYISTYRSYANQQGSFWTVNDELSSALCVLVGIIL